MKKYKNYMSDDEWNVTINALNELRTRLIDEGRYHDIVNEVLLKIIRAPIKNVKDR